jgi:hypothetical protein
VDGLTAGTHPDGITSGRDGHIWFTENGLSGAGAVARLNADGSVTEFSGGVAFSSRPTCNPQTSTTTTPPTLSQLVIRPARFRAGRGATISYVDSEPATTRFTVARTQPGVRVGSRCVASKRRRGVRHCSRLIVVDSFQHTDVSGGNTVNLPGRSSGKRLRPGSYTLVAVASDADGTGNQMSVHFRVQKPRRAGGR